MTNVRSDMRGASAFSQFSAGGLDAAPHEQRAEAIGAAMVREPAQEVLHDGHRPRRLARAQVSADESFHLVRVARPALEGLDDASIRIRSAPARSEAPCGCALGAGRV